MKIAISARGRSIDAAVDPRFGRCENFVLVNTEDMQMEVIDNNNHALGNGAGIQTARLMAENGVGAVLTGSCGPNAHRTLTAAGIAVYSGCTGRVADAVTLFNEGRLTLSKEPDVESHSGMNGPVR